MTDKETTRDKMTECYDCKFKQDVQGSTKIRCTNPDPNMQGHEYGIHHGHYCYPIFFHPVWKEDLCNNFEEKDVFLDKAIARIKVGEETPVAEATKPTKGFDVISKEVDEEDIAHNQMIDEHDEILSLIHEDDRERFEEIEKETVKK